MKPLFVRELSGSERHALQAGLRSSDGFTVRRCHILLASGRGDTTTVIAQAVGCSPQAVRNVLRAFEARGLAVRNVLRAFEARGLAVVAMQSRRPHAAAKLFDAERSERLKALLHQSPRQYGKARSTWTLALAAEVCAEHGITAERVSLETIRDMNRAVFVGGILAWVTLPPIGSSPAHGSAFRPRREVRGRWAQGDGGDCTRRPIREWRTPLPRGCATVHVDGSPRP